MSDPERRVLWAESAVGDLEALVAHIAQDSPGNAQAILARIRSRAQTLADQPARGRVVPEMAAFGFRMWRELLIKPYRLIYRQQDDHAVVLALLDGRRDLEDVLLERLTRP